jgi:hypothetical protein
MTKLTRALEKLGFTTEEQQMALLENLFFAGYFSEEKIEKDLMMLAKSGDFANKKNTAAKHVLQAHITIKMLEAERQQNGIAQLDTKQVLQNLFLDDDRRIDQQDVEDLVLFWCQNAFDREFGKERYELAKQDWMTIHKERYFENARTLQLSDAVEPTQKNYDEIWVQGASRPRVITRLNYTKNLLDSGKIEMTEIKLLAGDRELWAEIDGIGKTNEEKVADGVKYMIELAEKNGIKLGEPQFVKCEKDDKEAKRFAGRTYLNYAAGETRKVNEGLACEDLCQTILPQTQVEESSDVEKGHYRPTTFTTSKQAAEDLAKKLPALNFGEKSKKDILLIAEQPYSERMRAAVQTIFDGMKKDLPNYELNSHVAGNAAAVSVEGFHSELAALVAEKYKAMVQHEGVARKRDTQALMFQTREKFVKNLSNVAGAER